MVREKGKEKLFKMINADSFDEIEFNKLCSEVKFEITKELEINEVRNQ